VAGLVGDLGRLAQPVGLAVAREGPHHSLVDAGAVEALPDDGVLRRVVGPPVGAPVRALRPGQDDLLGEVDGLELVALVAEHAQRLDSRLLAPVPEFSKGVRATVLGDLVNSLHHYNAEAPRSVTRAVI